MLELVKSLHKICEELRDASEITEEQFQIIDFLSDYGPVIISGKLEGRELMKTFLDVYLLDDSLEDDLRTIINLKDGWAGDTDKKENISEECFTLTLFVLMILLSTGATPYCAIPSPMMDINLKFKTSDNHKGYTLSIKDDLEKLYWTDRQSCKVEQIGVTSLVSMLKTQLHIEISPYTTELSRYGV